jgi:hypothetical protein
MILTGLFDVYALLFGIFGGIIAIVCCYKGLTASGNGVGTYNRHAGDPAVLGCESQGANRRLRWAAMDS